MTSTTAEPKTGSEVALVGQHVSVEPPSSSPSSSVGIHSAGQLPDSAAAELLESNLHNNKSILNTHNRIHNAAHIVRGGKNDSPSPEMSQTAGHMTSRWNVSPGKSDVRLVSNEYNLTAQSGNSLEAGHSLSEAMSERSPKVIPISHQQDATRDASNQKINSNANQTEQRIASASNHSTGLFVAQQNNSKSNQTFWDAANETLGSASQSEDVENHKNHHQAPHLGLIMQNNDHNNDQNASLAKERVSLARNEPENVNPQKQSDDDDVQLKGRQSVETNETQLRREILQPVNGKY